MRNVLKHMLPRPPGYYGGLGDIDIPGPTPGERIVWERCFKIGFQGLRVPYVVLYDVLYACAECWHAELYAALCAMLYSFNHN